MICVIFMLSIADTGDYIPANNGIVMVDAMTSSPVEISVSLIDDPNFENDETFFVDLTGCSPGCVISPNQSAITITIQSDESKCAHINDSQYCGALHSSCCPTMHFVFQI